MTSETSPPSTFDKMLAQCRQQYPRFAGQWEASRTLFGDQWEKEFSAAAGATFSPDPNPAWDDMITGYAEFCTEALRAQVFFEKNGRYKADNYAAVNAECYQNGEFMLHRYLPGLYMSHYIWPHHYRLLRAFQDKLLPQLPADTRTFYEVGVGCGMYSQLTLDALPGITGVGFDISDHALLFTSRMMEAHGLSGRFTVHNQNIIETPIPEKADFIISQEVLEHLEDPPAFIRGLLAGVKPGGWGYITAAINAGHTDHIYLYRSPDEVRKEIEEAGWEVIDSVSESNYMDKPEHLRPTVAGFLVRRPS